MLISATSSAAKSTRKMKKVVATEPLAMREAAQTTGGGVFRSVGPGGFSFCRDRRFRLRCFSRTACCLFSLCLR